ncbi:hypothetical protein OEZ85_010815 [Tetradesmus obliquus]|uniref:FAD-binding PCMH-type domain-containing protein n=1 Tax=Tetradesmus obliquus TaxID=3088 RepID=A0ABY8TNE6_TETOB|nr:hypothetical protein OEZ85_010815 [Tetradesmus obliquus]
MWVNGCGAVVVDGCHPPPTLAVSPPKPPVTIKGTLVSAYGDTVCENQEVLQPTSTAEVAAAVKAYYKSNSPGNPVKIRVVTRSRGFNASDGYRQLGFHDRSGFACAKGGTSKTKTITLLTQNMRSVLGKNGVNVKVQPGMTVAELQVYATANNLTVPLGTMPGYADLTIGGLVATGAHGFGGKGNSNVADIVKVITFVDGTGKINRVGRNSRVGRGLAGGLGMLGVMTEITLQLQPGLGKARTWSTGARSDKNMAQELQDLWDKHSNMLIYWRPDIAQYKVVISEVVPSSTPFDPPFISTDLTPVGGFVKPGNDDSQQRTGQLITAVHLDVPTANFSKALCLGFGATILDANQFGWILGFKQGSGGVPEPVILDNATGLTNRVQNSDCDNPGTPQSGTGGCFFEPAAWERIHAKELAAMQTPDPTKLTPSFSFEEAEFTLNRKNLSAFIEDGKLMASKLLPGVCWPGSFFVMRTGGPTSDHIGPQFGSSSDRFLWVEYAQFRPNIPLDPTGQQAKPRLQKKASALQEYWEQLMVCKYKARPHWGKCWSRVFTSKACPIKDLYPASNWATQLSLQQQYDPAKLFETSMLSAVIEGGVEKPAELPFCTNELGCYCTKDSECGTTGVPIGPGPLCCQTAPTGMSPYKVCLPCTSS